MSRALDSDLAGLAPTTERPTERTASSFNVDLDWIAPLGSGSVNAAHWVREFSREDGLRYEEWHIAHRQRTDCRVAGKSWRVLPASHPLLAEAEAWVEQRACRFYPDVWEPNGPGTPLPNYHLLLTVARSWVARGSATRAIQEGESDFRRTVRLGRLLFDDAISLNDRTFGLTALLIGVQALHRSAWRRGDEVACRWTYRVLRDAVALHARSEEQCGAEVLIRRFEPRSVD